MAKGQWFILSAVIASAAFLSISLMYRGYFSIDTSSLAKVNEDFFFLNALEELNKTVSFSSSDAQLSENFRDYSEFITEKALGYGYSMTIANLSSLSILGTDYKLTLLSSKMNMSRVVHYP
jgi:hypothetical protein